ncbi:hypothetical protein ACH5RR_038220 [Cinchona calisaya]|uniref:Hydroxyproline-rich glycoprotein family protein n=1 Tax=Cinchona calisaya TaxID=153742 RepID=A0ABD2YAR7_9GENT
MRRSLAKFPYNSTTRPSSFISSSPTSPFSTSSGGGGGRGRGSIFPNFHQFTKEDPSPTSSDNKGFGHGQGGGGGAGGRGKPLPSSPTLPPFTSFVDRTAATGRGRGRGQGIGVGLGSGPLTPPTSSSDQPSDPSRKPIFLVKDGGDAPHDSHFPPPTQSPTIPGSSSRNPEENNLPSNILSVLSGAGRGKVPKQPSAVPDKPKEENRHIRARQQSPRAREDSGNGGSSPAPSPTQRLSREEAVKKAVGILSKGGGGDGRDEGTTVGRGVGGVSRGRGRGRDGRGRGGRRMVQGDRGPQFEDADDEDDSDDDNADGEKLAQRLGPDVMDQLVEAFEEMSSRVLPSPEDDAYLDALHTNLLIECEPEYMMGDFGTNPDIDEKPPVPLRDALEKMKPFLMAYEGIQSQQEWEEVVEETMKRVPLLKEIVDYYSGPDRVTAKQQQEELERVAKTLPEYVPAPVKRFTDRAVISLQSNPGWGFDKKCQLMDKLVAEISQHYK